MKRWVARKEIKNYDIHREKVGFKSTEEMAEAYTKALTYAIFTEKDYAFALEHTQYAKRYIEDAIKEATSMTIWDIEAHCQRHDVTADILYWYYQLCLLRSYWSLEDFILYLEKNRPQEKRFYMSRQETLRTIVWDFEDLNYRAIKFLGVSLPSRTGKSTVALLGIVWEALRDPDLSSATGTYSGALARAFHEEALNFITEPEYTFGEMYTFWHNTNVVLEDKSVEFQYLNLGSPSRFSTLVFRGIDQAWTGAVDVSLLLTVDDLIRDREHSLSPTRCENTWQEYLNKMVDRKSGKQFPVAKLIQYQEIYDVIRKLRGQEPFQLPIFDGALEMMIGTLWNVYDPLERMEKLHGGDPLYRFRKIPALNENDETNFPYQYTTEYLHDMRKTLDAPEWMAKWQQAPYVREGLLYQPNEMLYFNGECPEGKTIAVLDPAVGGGDNLSMLLIRIAGKKKYIIDWLYTNETKGKTIPAICNKVIFHNVTELHYERNGIGRAFEEDVTKELHLRNYFRCKSMPFNAPEGMSKEDKILGYSDWVKANLWFIAEDAKNTTYARSSDYVRALDDMFIYTTVGKNKYDDSVDNLAQAARVFEKSRNGTVDIILNPFR
jgi:hypothetical protein